MTTGILMKVENIAECSLCVCHIVLSVPCSHVVTSWEESDLLALLYCYVFLCFCHFPIWRPWSGVVFDCTDS